MTADPKLLTTMVRQSDHVRVGVFATEDITHPLLIAEENGTGGFDLSGARRVPFGEAFSIRQQIASATRAIN